MAVSNILFYMWKVFCFLFLAQVVAAQVVVPGPQMNNGQSGEIMSGAVWVYRNSGTLRYHKADADTDTMSAVGVNFIECDTAGELMQPYYGGMVVGWPSSLTKGADYYLSSTAGEMTATKPNTGSYQRLGYAADTFLFVIQIGPLQINYLEGSATMDFPDTDEDFGSNTLTATVTGAEVGDAVVVSISSYETFGLYQAWVSSANTVSVRFLNFSVVATDPPSRTVKIKVFK